MSIHNLYKQDVYLDKDQHRYFDTEGKEYMSFSALFGFLSPKFEAERIAYHVGRRDGKTTDEVLGIWKGATDEGTRLDAAIKTYSETGLVKDEDKELEEVIKKVSEKYVGYHSIYSDLVVFNKEFRVAGEIDRLSLISNRRDSCFHISDFKRFEKGMSYGYKGQKWLNFPFDYHLNSKYNKISWQLSFYARLFELLTGRKCERLFVDVIQPIIEKDKIVDYRNHEVPVAYLRADVDRFLEHFKSRIITKLEQKIITIDDEF